MPRLVAVPRHLDLVEAHGLDHAGIVGRVEAVDLQASALGDGLQERLPVLLLTGRGLGGEHAEIDLDGRLRAGFERRRRYRHGGCDAGQKGSQHLIAPLGTKLGSPAAPEDLNALVVRPDI
jgi:hypothetical protein